MNRYLKGLLLIGIFLSVGATSDKPTVKSSDAFARLKTLVGDWEGKTSKGRIVRVNFRLTASDSVLIETWTMSPTRESLTLYHMDGDSLVVTHYCPQGNQPRLQYVPEPESTTFRFRFRDGTNLQDKSREHQHSFSTRLPDEKSIIRSETYVKNGSTDEEIAKVPPGEAITFARVETAK